MNCSNCSEENLYEVSINNIKTEEIDISESTVNKTVLRTINNEGLLESIIETENLIIKQEYDNNNEDLDDSNDENISEEDSDNNIYNISFDIGSFSIDTINKINLKEKTSYDKL